MSGLIYKIVSPNGKIYIGQTVKKFNARMSCHKSAAATLNKNDGCRALNNAIRKYGWENMTKEIIEHCEIDQLDVKESFYIKKYNSISPYGYNLISGGNSNKTYSEQTKILQRNAALKRESKIYRTKEQTKDYPKYLGIWKGNPRITKHPKCSSKTFSDKNKTFEDNLEDAKTFLKELNNGEIEVIIPKRELPKGIQKMGCGFRVLVNINGKRIIKNFGNKSIPKDVRLEQAKTYLKELLEEHNMNENQNDIEHNNE